MIRVVYPKSVPKSRAPVVFSMYRVLSEIFYTLLLERKESVTLYFPTCQIHQVRRLEYSTPVWVESLSYARFVSKCLKSRSFTSVIKDMSHTVRALWKKSKVFQRRLHGFCWNGARRS